ncbi:Multidrug resistance-associated protein 1 [Hypsibius exemplaris]|uniref:ABC-type glutathione-S-conjugate transporter n=1 Tax=Hypsibius exemplaris TaxID=2072580 RepID=A0A1W0WUZ7_HYPEX|nr:Multidrug resistance-associated protein 1 [Hypsibius exemplaris]
MIPFCRSKFWDREATWNTNDPNLTECFRDTALVWIPCGFLCVFLPAVILQYRKSSFVAGKWTVPAIAKVVVAALLILVALSEFSYMLQLSLSAEIWSPGSSIASMMAQLVKVISFVLSILLINWDRRKGIASSGFQFTFWLLLTVCGTVEFRSQLKQALEGRIVDRYVFAAEMAYYPLVVMGFILFCFVDRDASPKNYAKSRWPEYHASYPSRLLFSWYSGLVYKGWKKSLKQTDLWELDGQDRTSTVVRKFSIYWQAELARQKATPTYQPSMVKAIWKTFWPLMLITGILQLIATVLLQTVALPFALRYMIGFVEEPLVESWKGYVVAVWLFVISVGFSIFLAQFYHFGSIIALRLRSALIGSIYRKSLRITAHTKKGKTAAEIANLMAVDAQRFTFSPIHVHSLWGCLLQIVISVYLLYQYIGPSVFAGIGAMLFTIPLVGVVMRKNRLLEATQLLEKDHRMKLMNEILNGIKILKLYAWEDSFEDKVQTVRNRELAALKKSANLKAINMITWLFTPSLIALVSFTTFVLSDTANILTPKTTFVSLALFGILRLPLALLPAAITGLIQSKLSLNRISAFLQSEELDLTTVARVPWNDKTVVSAVSVQNGTFAWAKDDEHPVLRDINIDIMPGHLVAVVGPVGSGKSSLCSAVLGMLEKLSGKIVLKGSVAYCSQTAWIQNLTVKDNILFGHPLDDRRYRAVIDACALRPDLEILPAGDETEIGERGINLSGGQKQRINIARAVYSDSDVYVLDDPLSAVDAHVAKHIFEAVIGPGGLLHDKTRLFVTNDSQYLPLADRVIYVRDGEVSGFAALPKLLHLEDFSEFHEQLTTSPTKLVEEPPSPHSNGGITDADDQLEKSLGVNVKTSLKLTTTTTEEDIELDDVVNGGEKGKKIRRSSDKPTGEEGLKLIGEETTMVGKVSWKIYGTLLKYATLIGTLVTVLCHAVYTGFVLAANLWLSFWAEDSMRMGNATVVDSGQRDYRLGVYALLNVFQALFVYISALVLALCCVKASQRLHTAMLHQLLRAPMHFFETTPAGRILNRFSKDLDTLDMQLPANFKMWLNGLFILLSVIVLICVSTPFFAAVVPVLAVCYVLIQRAFVPSSRQIKRLEAVSRSPILSHFQESLSGRPIILTMNQEDRFIELNDRLNDVHNMSSYANAVGQRWILIRVETLGAFCTFFAAFFAVMGRDSWDAHPGLLGLAITYATTMTSSFNWLVRESSEIEANVVSVERMHEYTEIEQEAPWRNRKTQPAGAWPEFGSVAFHNYGLRYRGGHDLVLRNVNFSITGGEWIGVCGRTGAGKSSLISALFRLVEPAAGTIRIDALDIGQLGLHDLRSKLTIIPQDPVLFSGTLLTNLDPLQQHNDQALWDVLESVNMKPFVKEQTGGLLMDISESGDNLSVGQRQLICLARALLRSSKIVILDEATASIDSVTDLLIQETMKRELRDCTVITVAHRLSTIMNYDRIMVLEQGEVVEFDAPEILLKDTGSLFYGLAVRLFSPSPRTLSGSSRQPGSSRPHTRITARREKDGFSRHSEFQLASAFLSPPDEEEEEGGMLRKETTSTRSTLGKVSKFSKSPHRAAADDTSAASLDGEQQSGARRARSPGDSDVSLPGRENRDGGGGTQQPQQPSSKRNSQRNASRADDEDEQVGVDKDEEEVSVSEPERETSRTAVSEEDESSSQGVQPKPTKRPTKKAAASVESADEQFFVEDVEILAEPAAAEEDPNYEVQAILEKRFQGVGRRKTVQYLIKWVGYADPTWEPRQCLDGSKELLAAFEAREKTASGGKRTKPVAAARKTIALIKSPVKEPVTSPVAIKIPKTRAKKKIVDSPHLQGVVTRKSHEKPPSPSPKKKTAVKSKKPMGRLKKVQTELVVTDTSYHNQEDEMEDEEEEEAVVFRRPVATTVKRPAVTQKKKASVVVAPEEEEDDEVEEDEEEVEVEEDEEEEVEVEEEVEEEEEEAHPPKKSTAKQVGSARRFDPPAAAGRAPSHSLLLLKRAASPDRQRNFKVAKKGASAMELAKGLARTVRILAHKPQELEATRLEEVDFLLHYGHGRPDEFVDYETCIQRIAPQVAEYLARHTVIPRYWYEES